MRGSVVVVIICFSILVNVYAQSEWENIFLTIPTPEKAREYLIYYTSSPHVAGTPEDYATATYTKNMLESFGLTAVIDTHDVYINYPVQRQLTLISPVFYNATLQEVGYPQDPTSNDPRIIPTFNGYSASGNVTAEVIYVNYGRFEDFETLKENGISVENKIVLVRYGQIFRGLKVMLAEMNGAIGCIIYSDPADDGFVRGPPYPEGPWRPESGVQRGSTLFLSLCPGDPRNPLCRENDNQNYTNFIPRIPVQPISWGDAQHLLRNLGGPSFEGWQGGLPFNYRIGPGPAVANLYLNMSFKVTPIWNVIATIPGESDEIVFLGNHRDAWVFGAGDPNSGSSAMLEVARGYSELVKRGWKPKRTIMFGSWDGEEYGLLGSTAYADANADLLTRKVITYINVDGGCSGMNFNAGATHSFNSLLHRVASIIIDPRTGQPLSSVWQGPIGTLGSGSDYTAFFHRYGVASFDLGFDSSAYSGVYHSIYDSFHWMSTFGNPQFDYYKAIAQFWGLVGIKLADDVILPFNYTDHALDLETSLQTIRQLLIEYDGVDKVDLNTVQKAIAEFKNAAFLFGVWQKKILLLGDLQAIKASNEILYLTERQFLGTGLKQRPYYRHVIQAPGLYMGYGTQVFPGVAQAIMEFDWDQANEEVNILANLIEKAALFLKGNLKDLHKRFLSRNRK